MNKKCYRFFGGMVKRQSDWLNRMAAQGWRLVKTEKMLYEFEECSPDAVQYCVEFVGNKSKADADAYADFLRDCGYQIFFKTINLNWNFGKVQIRPWANKGGRLATNQTTFNRELLIVEKENDGKPFVLHTTSEDKLAYCKELRKPWIFFFVVFAVVALLTRAPVAAVFSGLSLLVILIYQFNIQRLKKAAQTEE